MKNNNPNLMKTLKTINNVIGKSHVKYNQNNSTKESKKYEQTKETYYRDKKKSNLSTKNHKNYKEEENQLRLFQEKMTLRKWLNRLQSNPSQCENGQKKKSHNNKRKSDLQNICYADHFRVPPKHYVDRMRRTLPNFEFNHIEEVRKDKYDIKLLWPVNNILFPPDEKENRVHKIPVAGRNEYLEQVDSIKRLSKPKTVYTAETENEIYNKYYKRHKISQREALELCQRLNFKPTQPQNYNYINDYYNEERYEERQNRKSYNKRSKHSSFSHNSKCHVETDQNLSDLTAQLAQNGRLNQSSSNDNQNQSNSRDKSNSSNEYDEIKNINTNKIIHSDEEIFDHSNKNNHYNMSFDSSNEEHTEIVSDSYLMDISANQIKKKKDSSIIEEEEEIHSSANRSFSSGSNRIRDYSKDNIRIKISGEEEEFYDQKITNNNQVSNRLFEEEEEIHSSANRSFSSGSNKIRDYSNNNIRNKINEEEEEFSKSSKIMNNNQTITSSYNNINTEIINDEEEEIFKNKIKISNSSLNHIHTGFSDEEEEFYSQKITNNNNQVSNELFVEEESSDDEIVKNILNIKDQNNSSGSNNNKIQFSYKEEEEEFTEINNTQNTSFTNKIIKAFEEEEEIISENKTSNNNSYNKIKYQIFDEEEEDEFLDKMKTKNSNQHRNFDIDLFEEEEEEFSKNNKITNKIKNNQISNNISTEINEEEEINSSNKNIVTKTTTKVIKTTSTATKITNNNIETPKISRVVQQFNQSTSKNYDDINDELFSDSSVGKGILVGSTSSGIGPIHSGNNSGTDDEIITIHSSGSTDSFA